MLTDLYNTLKIIRADDIGNLNWHLPWTDQLVYIEKAIQGCKDANLRVPLIAVVTCRDTNLYGKMGTYKTLRLDWWHNILHLPSEVIAIYRISDGKQLYLDEGNTWSYLPHPLL